MPEAAFLIRPATDADLPIIAAIYGRAVATGTSSFELEPPDLAEMTRRRKLLVEKDFPYFTAERDGTLLGYAYAGAYHQRPGYRNTVEDSIYVAPEAHRQGVGRALLRALIAASEERGYRQMVAIIGGSDNHASISLHTAEGFMPVGVLKSVGYKHGRWLDSVLMQRVLGPGASVPPGR